MTGKPDGLVSLAPPTATKVTGGMVEEVVHSDSQPPIKGFRLPTKKRPEIDPNEKSDVLGDTGTGTSREFLGRGT